MQLARVRLADGEERVGVLHGERLRLLGVRSLSEVLHADRPGDVAAAPGPDVALAEVTLLPPIDRQEVWAAGVTYKRSEEARKRESAGGASFYDKVYTAQRPELFFKASAGRVVGPGGAVRVRADSRWSVPEPELALVVTPALKIVGYTIGNDMSARDIEGENPLYLPQAKFYDGSCSLGPVVTLAGHLPPPDRVGIRLTIGRGGSAVFTGSTTMAMMHRTPESLVGWLGRETSFPDGAILLTGTGIVPPDEFTLAGGDVVTIEIDGIGRLVNTVH
jgi:2-dehydro-3-deoxy-D-arabinonate dehydratase